MTVVGTAEATRIDTSRKAYEDLRRHALEGGAPGGTPAWSSCFARAWPVGWRVTRPADNHLVEVLQVLASMTLTARLETFR